MRVGGAIFWEAGGRWKNTVGEWGWVGLGWCEWGWVHCFVMPFKIPESSFRNIHLKSYSENVQLICRSTPMQK